MTDMQYSRVFVERNDFFKFEKYDCLYLSEFSKKIVDEMFYI